MRMDSVQVMQDKQKNAHTEAILPGTSVFTMAVFSFLSFLATGEKATMALLSSFRTALFEGDALLPHEAPILLHMAKKQPLIAAGYIA